MRHLFSVCPTLLWPVHRFRRLPRLGQPLSMVAACGIFVALTPLATQAQTCVCPPPGMVAWWPGDGNANDIVAGQPTTLVNGATFGPGLVGQAFKLDGVDDGISILKSPALNLGTSDFTIDAWVKVAAIVGGSGPIFFNYAGVPSYGLQVDQTGRAQIFFRPGVAIIGGGPQANPSVTATGTTVLTDGQWHHVAGVRIRATALIFVDGLLEGSATNPTVLNVNFGGVDTSGCKYARIGSLHTAPNHCTSLNPNPAEARFQGLIDEVEIFNRALCATEIQAIFNAGKAGKCKH